MPRRSAWIASMWLCLCLPLTLTGCVGSVGIGGIPGRLSQLHIAGLRYMPGLTRLVDDTLRSDPGFAIFQGAGDATPRVLWDNGTHLHVVGLDGSGDRQLAIQTECEGMPAVTADGQWGACLGYNIGFSSSSNDRLEIFSLAGSARQHQFTLNDSADSYFGLAWSPDKSHLALVETEITQTGLTCAVQVYTAGADYASLELASSFTSDAFVYSHGCHVAGLGWSRDGSLLDIFAQSPDSLLLDDDVALASPELGPGASLAIPAEQFVSTPIDLPVTSVAENPQTGSFALNGSGHELMYYSAGTQPVGTWFTMPDTVHVLFSMGWTPDGGQVLLQVGSPFCVDSCNRAPPDVYLYTPPTTG